MRRRRFLAAALLLLGSPLAAQQPGATTVFVVRHAEKGPENPDPSLTVAGRQRADALARALSSAGVNAFFASEFKRTQETVAPLAAQAGAGTTVVPARDVDRLVAALRTLPAGSRALVASHSNLVHLIVEKLSGVKVPELTEADYDRLFVVTLAGPGTGSVVTLRYGDAYQAGSSAPMKP